MRLHRSERSQMPGDEKIIHSLIYIYIPHYKSNLEVITYDERKLENYKRYLKAFIVLTHLVAQIGTVLKGHSTPTADMM